MALPDDTTLPVEPFQEPEVAPPPSPSSLAPDRLVFFFSGFDPKGATFYHRLFRAGAGERNATHADALEVGSRHAVGRWASAWTASWRGTPEAAGAPPPQVRTRVHFMRWDDLVRRHWRRSALQLVADYWNVYVLGISSGVFRRVRQKTRAAWWLALFPLGVAAGCIGAGLALVGGALWAAGLPAALGALAGLFVGIVAWRLVARRIDCEWLLRLYAFTRLQAVGKLPELDVRQDELADHVVEAVESRLHQPGAPPLREVLLVGYSTGSTMAAAVAARALRRLTALTEGRYGRSATSIAIVTLGHCIPVAADWGGARRTRAELKELADCPQLTWHDYSAPADWAAFWRTPPWPEPARLQGLQASPRFHAHMTPQAYAALRRDRREMHLQYLRPPALRAGADAYDYFMLTCGPLTLAERHARGRPSMDARE